MKLPDGIIQPVPFIEGLCTLEGGSRIKLFPHQKVIIPALIESPAAECIYSSIKRSAKSTIGAALTVWGSTQLGPPHMPPGDFLIASRTHLAAQSGVGRMVWGMFEREPALMDLVDTMTASEIRLKNGNRIRVVAINAGAVAGTNMIMCVVDETWSFDQEAFLQFADQTGPIHSNPWSKRIQTTYAGWTGQSLFLERIWKLAEAGEWIHPDLPIYENREAGVIGYLDQGIEARRFPWQVGEEGERHYAQQRLRQRPTAYDQQDLNIWTSGEEAAFPPEQWAAIEDENHRCPAPDKSIRLFVGVDLGWKSDASVVQSVYRGADGRLYGGPSGRWEAPRGQTLSLQVVVDRMLQLRDGYTLQTVSFDDTQGVYMGQLLEAEGIPMESLPMSGKSLTRSTTALLAAVQDRQLVLYPDEQLRQEAMNVQLKVTPNSVIFAKQTSSRKIDSIVALSFAVLAAVRAGRPSQSLPAVLGRLRSAGGPFEGSEGGSPWDPDW